MRITVKRVIVMAAGIIHKTSTPIGGYTIYLVTSCHHWNNFALIGVLEFHLCFGPVDLEKLPPGVLFFFHRSILSWLKHIGFVSSNSLRTVNYLCHPNRPCW